jgi:PAS domain S-box-containing protein
MDGRHGSLDELEVVKAELRAARALAERRLQGLDETQALAKVGSWVVDLATNELTWSDENFRIFGVDKTTTAPSYALFMDRIHPEDRALVARHYQESVATGQPFVCDHRVLMPDGEIKFVHDRCQTFYDENRRPLRSVGTAQDITDRRAADAALEDSRRALRAVLDTVPQRVVWKDLDSVFLGCNRAFARDMGFTEPEDLVGKNDFVGTSKANAESYQADDREVMTSGVPKLHYEEQITDFAGKASWIRTSKVPLRWNDGTISGVLVTYEDVSDRKRLEQQLAHAQRLESIGTLAAGMAHEINNPLTFVLGNVELSLEWLGEALGETRLALHREPGAAGLQRAVERLQELVEPLSDAREGAERVRRLVLDIKGMARVEEAPHALHDLEAIIQAAVKQTSASIRHAATVQLELGASPRVEASEGALVQVFTNLLINAAHAIGDGNAAGNSITIATSTDPDGRACVSIQDTGPGIPAAIMPRIFDPFFTTKRVGSGTGLGLSTSHAIVTALGGSLSAENASGGGAIFRVRLPAAAIADATVEPPPESRTLATGAQVLVIDDEPSVAIALGRMLRNQHQVTVTTDGREALALLASGKVFDLIFCDLMMPNISGIEVYRSMAARNDEHTNRIVFMTGGAFTPASQEFLDGVGNLYISKPFTVQSIRSIAAARLGTTPPC